MVLCLFRFLKLQPCGKNGYSPLHLAVDRNTTCVGRYPVCKFPSLTVASILLECGADVNSRDNDDNRSVCSSTAFALCLTILVLDCKWKDIKSSHFFLISPLHIAASNGHPDIMNLLISSGSHFDSTNAFQQTPCDLLDAKELSRNVIQPINHTTLQCLAARTIIKHSLNYRGNIPEKLEAFVLLHR